MKKTFCLLFLLPMFSSTVVLADHPYGSPGTQFPVQKSMNPSPYGYEEYLPVGYGSDTNKKYALMYFMHGSGENGDGNGQLPNVCANGPPMNIKNGWTYPVIVLSPQSPDGSWPAWSTYQFIKYACTNYRIDTNRIYITGLSMGGGGVWHFVNTYPNIPACAVPCAGYEPTVVNAQNLTNFPVWAFHCMDDPTVSVNMTINWADAVAPFLYHAPTVSLMSNYPGQSYQTASFVHQRAWSWQFGFQYTSDNRFQVTIFNVGGHPGGWQWAYASKELTNWMFRQSKPKLAIQPSPPQLVSPLNGVSVLSPTPLLVWNPCVTETGISNYTVEVSSSPVFSVIQQTGICQSTSDLVNLLPVGTWYWRVRARDKNQLISLNSVARSFVVKNIIPVKGGTFSQSCVYKSGTEQLTNSLSVIFPSGYSVVPATFSAFFTNKSAYSKVSLNSNFMGSYELISSEEYSQIPVQITLKYSAEEIPPGTPESQIGLYCFNGVEWVKIDGTLDTANNVFIFNSNKLSGEYAFFVTNPNYLSTQKKPITPDMTHWSYNPFSPNGDGKDEVTRIELNLVKSSKVAVQIFDRTHRLVRDLMDAPKVSGRTYIEWDGKDDKGKVVKPGAYIYMIRINETLRKGIIVVAY